MKSIKKTFIQQHDQSDCGVACLLSIVNYHNGYSSFDRIRNLSGTTHKGTSILGLLEAANASGLEASGVRINLDNLIKQKSPVILHVEVDNGSHFIIFYGIKKDKYLIGDPAEGIGYYSKKELNKIWVSKAAIILSPSSNFPLKKNYNRYKLQWVLDLLKEDKKIIVNSIILGVIISILGISMAVFSKKLIDEILLYGEKEKLIVGVISVFLLILIKIGLSASRSSLILSQAKSFNVRLTNDFYSNILNRAKRFFETRNTGDLIARLNDTTRIQRVVSQIVSSSIIDILIVLITFPVLFFFSIEAGYVILLGFLLYFVVIFFSDKLVGGGQKKIMQHYALNESNYVDSIKNIDVIQSFDLKDKFVKKNNLIYGDFQNRIIELGNLRIKLTLITSIISLTIQFSVITILSFQIIDEVKQIGDLVAVLSIIGILSPSITGLALINIPINEAKVALDRIHETINIRGSDSAKNGNRSIDTFKDLRINDLSFRFPGKSRLLKNVSVKVKKGQSIAILGESGTGKSTLIKLIQRVETPENGEILVNNEPINLINDSSWLKFIGTVPQTAQILKGSIVYNICIKEDQEEFKNVIDFCKLYGFHDFIKDFDNSYLTYTGEDGENLSGGQKQLILLARALYHKPKILLLDEPTSAMGRDLENFTLSLLNELKKDLGIIIITHEIKGASHADYIYLLEKGEIVDGGSPSELLQSENLYSKSYFDLLSKS